MLKFHNINHFFCCSIHQSLCSNHQKVIICRTTIQSITSIFVADLCRRNIYETNRSSPAQMANFRMIRPLTSINSHEQFRFQLSAKQKKLHFRAAKKCTVTCKSAWKLTAYLKKCNTSVRNGDVC